MQTEPSCGEALRQHQGRACGRLHLEVGDRDPLVAEAEDLLRLGKCVFVSKVRVIIAQVDGRDITNLKQSCGEWNDGHPMLRC